MREIGAKRLELVTPKKDILYRYITKINPQPRSVPNNELSKNGEISSTKATTSVKAIFHMSPFARSLIPNQC